MTIETTETEQTEVGEQAPSIPSRDDLIAAVREAGGTESVNVAEEEAEAAARTANGGTAPAPKTGESGGEGEPEEPRIAAILKARAKANQELEAGRNQAKEIIEQARQESMRLVTEARETAQREAAAERERLRAEFRGSPAAALRTLGTPQEISDAVMREGTAEGRAMQALERELAETKQKVAVADDVKKQFDDFRAEQGREAQAAQIAQVRERFLASASKEAAPYLHARLRRRRDFCEGQQRRGRLEERRAQPRPCRCPQGGNRL